VQWKTITLHKTFNLVTVLYNNEKLVCLEMVSNNNNNNNNNNNKGITEDASNERSQ
jgi:hypothetical protein